jgi:hypothetical protein
MALEVLLRESRGVYIGKSYPPLGGISADGIRENMKKGRANKENEKKKQERQKITRKLK